MIETLITKVYIEEKGGRRMEPEMRDVYDELTERGIPVELFTQKRIHRRQLPVTKESFVVGYVQTFLSALNILGIEPPPTNDYPAVLSPFFHRRIWESTVAELTRSVYEDGKPLFAKPKGRKKRFTGHVFRYPDDLAYLEGASHATPIFCSEVVHWLSEYRVFVTHGEIVGIKLYDGDSAFEIDETVVKMAIQLLQQSNEATAGYSIDFGVIAGGQTAVVEWNDGFSLGSYGLDRGIYTDLLIARWNELTGQEALPH